MENAVQAGCEKNEIEKRVKLRNDIRETQKTLESISMLPSNGVAEVQVDDDGFYYIREQDDLPLGSETLFSKESNIFSTNYPVDWDNIMAKLNKYEEMEGGEETRDTDKTENTSSQKVRFKNEKVKVEEQVPSILQSSSSIPFSGKITERSTSSTSSTQTLSRPKSLFAQMNRG